MIDAHHLGGLRPWMRAAASCEVAHLPVATHLSPEIGVHLAAAASNCRILEYMDWSRQLFNEELELASDGQILVPERPGFGVSLNEELLASRTVR